MGPRILAALVVLATGMAAQSFTVTVDYSKAPELAEYGTRAKALAEQWYVRINDVLFGPGAPLKHREIRIIIDPAAPKPYADGNFKGSVVASSFGGVIHLHAEWLARDPQDFETTVVHEVSHVNQDNYALYIARCDGIHAIPCFFRKHFASQNKGVGWLAESINYYSGFVIFKRKLEPTLRIDQSGYLTGYDESINYLYGLQQNKVRIRDEGYKLGYTVGATFLLWLERTKDKDIVRKLNLELSTLKGSPAMFQRYCGAPLDKLWSEFLAASRVR